MENVIEIEEDQSENEDIFIQKDLYFIRNNFLKMKYFYMMLKILKIKLRPK